MTILSCIRGFISAASGNPLWFHDMTPTQQKAYLAGHPGSRLSHEDARQLGSSAGLLAKRHFWKAKRHGSAVGNYEEGDGMRVRHANMRRLHDAASAHFDAAFHHFDKGRYADGHDRMTRGAEALRRVADYQRREFHGRPNIVEEL